MSEAPLTPEERRELIDTCTELDRQTSYPLFDTLTSGQRKRANAQRYQLYDEYAARLPAAALSRCPICEAPLEYVLDSMGLDGPWWFDNALTEYPEPEEKHFRVLLGAIDFHDREPAEAQGRPVLPGPGVPFVVPYMLEIPDMQAVISSLTLPHGDTAYAIAYFSPDPVHGAHLHQPWAREDYAVYDEGGNYEGWGVVNRLWDFDLRPWIDKGVVSWINPEDESLTIQRDGECPYENLPGVQAPQKILKGKLSLLKLPTGQTPQAFENPYPVVDPDE